MSVEDLRLLKKKLQDKRMEEDLKENNKLNEDRNYFLFPLELDCINGNNVNVKENIKVILLIKLKKILIQNHQ